MQIYFNYKICLKILAVIQLLFFLLFIGCSERTAREKEGKIIVRFWHAMGGPLGEVLDSMIDEFNDDHPRWFIKSES
ncbi:MAG: hypothetical protein U9N73_07435, partial [Candidatus Auribacterota bacterium]|nr:hypothetical protein [Candidatus Auribacterota bacterium]